MTMPDAGTRLCAVVGHPIAHSLSPVIHNAALRHDGIDAVYLAFDVAADGFAAAVEGLRSLGCAGINVTLPHKAVAFQLATERGEEASRTGSANTLVFAAESITAHNTDVVGVVRALADLGVEPEGARCVVIGAGGAGRGAVWALATAGASRVDVVNRTPDRGRDAAALAQAADVDGEGLEWEVLEEAVCAAEIVVHATSVGLTERRSPVDARVLERAAVGGCRGLLDLVYAREETELVASARAAGIPSADGLGVLVHQAAAAYERFWDRAAPVSVMHEAAAQATGRRPRPHEETPPLV